MILTFSKKFPSTLKNVSQEVICDIEPNSLINLGLKNISFTKIFYKNYFETAFTNILNGKLEARNLNNEVISNSDAACEFINMRSIIETYSEDFNYYIPIYNTNIVSNLLQIETFPFVLCNGYILINNIQGNMYLSSVLNQYENKINKICTYVNNGSGVGKFGIYKKNGNVFNLIAQSATLNIINSGLIIGSFLNDVVLEKNTIYWLGFAASSYSISINSNQTSTEISSPHHVSHVLTYIYNNPPTIYDLPNSFSGGSSTTSKIWLSIWYEK